MRLGDLDALKDAINKIIDEEIKIDEKWAMGLKYSLKIIDNAPTVFSCNACKNMGNEQECVDCHDYSNYVHYDERPQGEWITGGKDVTGQYFYDEFICNQCFTVVTNKSNFCPKCGADMRKGSAE